MLAVDVAEPASRVAKFLSANPVGFRVVLDADRAVTKAWAVATLPTTIVLGPDLQPRFIAEGQMDWENPDVVAQLRTLTKTTQQPAVQGEERMTPTRRALLKSACAAPAILMLPRGAFADIEFAPVPGAWRTFETTLRMEIAKPGMQMQAWLPSTGS